LGGFETKPPPTEGEEKAPWMAPAGGRGGPEGENRKFATGGQIPLFRRDFTKLVSWEDLKRNAPENKPRRKP